MGADEGCLMEPEMDWNLALSQAAIALLTALVSKVNPTMTLAEACEVGKLTRAAHTKVNQALDLIEKVRR